MAAKALGTHQTLAPLALVLGTVLLLSACASGAYRFEARLPPELPDISGWERSVGRAQLGSSGQSVDYELYVSPQRPAFYGVTRYRVNETAGPANEKLQWDRDGRDVRRYACAREGPAAGAPCRWRELARGSSEYDYELNTLVAVYFLHAERLHQRAAAQGR